MWSSNTAVTGTLALLSFKSYPLRVPATFSPLTYVAHLTIHTSTLHNKHCIIVNVRWLACQKITSRFCWLQNHARSFPFLIFSSIIHQRQIATSATIPLSLSILLSQTDLETFISAGTDTEQSLLKHSSFISLENSHHAF